MLENDQDLIRSEPGTYPGTITPAVPLIPWGMQWFSRNPFAERQPIISVDPSVDFLTDQWAVIAPEAKQHPTTGVWYGGGVVGLHSKGSNIGGAVNTNRIKGGSEQDGIFVDAAKPFAALCYATLHIVSDTGGDGMTGPLTAWACQFKDYGRDAFVMHFDGAAMVQCHVLPGARHMFALETGRRIHGVRIQKNKFEVPPEKNGNYAGYFSCPFGPGNGYDFGLDFSDNEGIGKINWEWDQKINSGSTINYAIRVNRNKFPALNPKIPSAAYRGPYHGVSVWNAVDVECMDNHIPCEGEFFDGGGTSKLCKVSGNDGSFIDPATKQVKSLMTAQSTGIAA
jgi:hypothetical protein